MSAKAIKSIWIEGADKSTTIKDHFGKSVSQIASNIKKREIMKIEDAWDDFRGKGGKIETFLSKFKIGGSLPVNEFKKILDTVRIGIDAGKQGLEIYKNFKDKNFEALLGNLSGIVPGEILDNAKFGLDMYRDLKAVDWKDWHSIMDLANKITGIDIPDYLGITAIQAQVEGLLALAQKNGVFEAIDMIKKKIHGNPKITAEIYRGLTPNARLNQFQTIEALMPMLDGKTASFMNPLLVKDILANFRLPSKFTEEVMADYRKRLVATLAQIDPMWDKEVIDGVTYYQLAPWKNVSRDVELLFKSEDPYGQLMITAKSHPEITLKAGLNATYPYLKLKH